MAQSIREVMTPDAATLTADQPVIEAARRMRDLDIGDVIVLDGGEVAGIVTDRDIVVRGLAEGRDLASTPVTEVCSGDVVTISPDDSIEQAARIMRERAVRRLPVVENGKPVGVVSIGDLAIEADTDSALAGISAAPPNN